MDVAHVYRSALIYFFIQSDLWKWMPYIKIMPCITRCDIQARIYHIYVNALLDDADIPIIFGYRFDAV